MLIINAIIEGRARAAVSYVTLLTYHTLIMKDIDDYTAVAQYRPRYTEEESSDDAYTKDNSIRKYEWRKRRVMHGKYVPGEKCQSPSRFDYSRIGLRPSCAIWGVMKVHY